MNASAKKHVFIVNPAAGRAVRPEETVAKIRAAMDPLGLPYCVEITKAPGHAAELVKSHAAAGGYFLFYACGGDGTLNEVVCGAANLPNVSVTHYPTGTGNDFIRQLGDRAALRFTDLAALADGEERRVDALQVGTRYALNVFSMGFDARVPAEMRRFKKASRFGSKMPYNLAVISCLFKGIGEHYEVKVDDRDYSGEYTLVTAMNGRYYGGGFNPAPGALVNDGLIDVILAKKVGLLGFARLIGPYSKGRTETMKIITYLRAKSVQIKSLELRPVNLDGECAAMKSALVFVRPGCIRFVTPKDMDFEHAGKKTM